MDFDHPDSGSDLDDEPPKCIMTGTTVCLCDFDGPKYKPVDSLGSTIDSIHPLSPYSGRIDNEGVCVPFERMYGFPPEIYQIAIPSERASSIETLICEERFFQRTIAIVKPEYMQYKDVVLRAITESGFSTIASRTVHLSPEQVAELFAHRYGCPSFPNLVLSVSMGPILVLSLADMNAVKKWQHMIGPASEIKSEWFFPLSVRTRFGLHLEIPDALHGSESIHYSNKENRFFYPRSVLEPIITDENMVKDYCSLYINPTLVAGLVELCKVKPVDPILFLAEWLLLNNPYQPNLPYHAALAPT